MHPKAAKLFHKFHKKLEGILYAMKKNGGRSSTVPVGRGIHGQPCNLCRENTDQGTTPWQPP